MTAPETFTEASKHLEDQPLGLGSAKTEHTTG